jgi:hypothetical protein
VTAPASRDRLIRLAAIAVGAVTAVLFGLWLVRRASRLPDRGRAAAAGPAAPVAHERAGWKRPPAFTSGAPAADIPPSDLGPGRHFAYYQGKSGRLAANRTPVVGEPVTKVSSTEKAPTLEVWVPSVRASKAGTTVFASVAAGPGTVVHGPPLVAIAPVDDGAPSAFSAMETVTAGSSERTYRQAFVPPAESAPTTEAGRTSPPRQYRYQVVLRGTRDGAPFERRAGGLFFVHAPGALVDPASAALAPEGGDLVLSLTASVSRAGSYFVYAELWGGKDAAEPIAFARDRLPALGGGQQRLSLRFGGRILHDAGVDGPYVVRNVRLQQVDTHPAHEADPIAQLPVTPAWRADSFR